MEVASCIRNACTAHTRALNLRLFRHREGASSAKGARVGTAPLEPLPLCWTSIDPTASRPFTFRSLSSQLVHYCSFPTIEPLGSKKQTVGGQPAARPLPGCPCPYYNMPAIDYHMTIDYHSLCSSLSSRLSAQSSGPRPSHASEYRIKAPRRCRCCLPPPASPPLHRPSRAASGSQRAPRRPAAPLD